MNDRYPYSSELPVSAKYYARLVERVRTILKDLHIYIQWRENAILCRINHYISPGRTDIPYAQADKYCNIIFQALRAEIDTAVERSRRARARAAARRALREAGKNSQQLAGTVADSADRSDRSNFSDSSDSSDISDISDRSESSESSESSEMSERSESSEKSEKSVSVPAGCRDGDYL